MRALWVVIAWVSIGCAAGPSSTLTAADTAASVATGSASYGPGASIDVTWAGLPGNPHDWIALAPAASAPTTVLRWAYTGGAVAGAAGFAGLPPGAYVARAFVDDSYTVLAEAAVAVAGVTIGHDRAGYVAGAPITITWAGLPGTATDWIGLAPEGASATTVATWVYTGGAPAGSHTFALGAPGRFVARAFPADSYAVAGESAAFTNGLTVATDRDRYAPDQPITVSWAQLPGTAHDWIALAPAGSPPTTVTTWVYAGADAGSHAFASAPLGTLVARAFVDDSYDLLVESAPFTVAVAAPAVAITVAHAAIGWGQPITVTWSGFPTHARDWIALAPAGSPLAEVTRFVYTGGASAGSHTFADGVASVGSYVARGFLDDTSAPLGESAPFTVQDRCVSLDDTPPLPGDDDFTGVGNPLPIVLSPVGAGVARTLLCVEEASAVQLGGDGFARFAAPRLRRVYGDLEATNVLDLALPRLAQVGGALRLRPFGDVVLPSLTAAGGLDVRAHSLSLPALDTLTGAARLQVDALSLGALAVIPGELQLLPAQAGAIGAYSAPALTRIAGNALIIVPVGVDFPRLARIEGDATLRAEQIALPALTYLFSLFVNGSVSASPQVRSLQLPALRRVENIFSVQSNPALSSCEVDAILARLSPPPNLITVGDNQPCAP